MKIKHFLFACIAGSLFGIVSCDQAMEDNFPGEYASVLHFQVQEGENETTVKLLKTGEPGHAAFSIGKSGNDPSAGATGTLRVLTDTEMEAYNNDNNTAYKILPARYYTLSAEKLVFDGKENKQTVDVTFLSSAMAEELVPDPASYVLPVRLESPDATVHEELSLLILRPSIDTPTVTLGLLSFQSVEMNINDATTGKILSLPLYIDLSENKWIFGVTFETETETLQDAVDAYRAENPKTDYVLLPSANYTLPEQVDFQKGELLVMDELVIDRSGLAAGNYLLPVLLKGCTGQPFDVDPTPAYIHLYVKDQLPEIALTAGMLFSTRSEPGRTGWDTAHPIDYLIDGNPDTYWQSEWTVYTDPGNPNKPHDPKYGLYVDIALEQAIQAFAFDFQAAVTGPQPYPARIQIYVGDSAVDLDDDAEPVADLTEGLPDTKKAWYKSVNFRPGRSFRYIRFAVIQNREGKDLRQKLNSSVSVGELKFYGQ